MDSKVQTIYGDISSQSFNAYLMSLRGRIWKLLPLREEKCDTLNNCIIGLIQEVQGCSEVFDKHPHGEYMVTVGILLHNSLSELADEDFSSYRKHILRCCNLIDKVGVE